MTWCGSSMCKKRDAPANVVPSAPRMPWTIAAAQRSRSEPSRAPTRTIVRVRVSPSLSACVGPGCAGRAGGPPPAGARAGARGGERARADLAEPLGLRRPGMRGPRERPARDACPAVEGLKALEGPFQRAHHVEGRRREPFFLYRRPRRARENREKVAPGRERLVFPRKTLQRGREEREGERPGREVERELDRDFGAVVVGEQMRFLRRETVEKGRHPRRFVREHPAGCR